MAKLPCCGITNASGVLASGPLNCLILGNGLGQAIVVDFLQRGSGNRVERAGQVGHHVRRRHLLGNEQKQRQQNANEGLAGHGGNIVRRLGNP